jgi:hypothetical protein
MGDNSVSFSSRRPWSVLAILASACHIAPAVAASPMDTPEDAIAAYLKIPTAEWQGRLSYVANPDNARPWMEKWYSKNVSSTGATVTAVSGATNPAHYRSIGDTLKVSATYELSDGSKGQQTFFVARTSEGFKIDWIQTFRPSLVSEGLWEQGRLAADAELPEIAVKHLEAVGERFESKPVRMLSLRFEETTNLWLTNLPGVMIDSDGLVTRYDKKAANGWVGFSATDRNGRHGGKFFAPKEKWADRLLELKRGQLINIVGVVTPLEQMTDYGILVYDIEFLE